MYIFSADHDGLFANHIYQDKSFVDFVTLAARRFLSAKKSELMIIQETILLKLGVQKEQIQRGRKKSGCFIL